MQPFITERMTEIEELCRKHHVRRLSVFGSAVREDFDPARSDVDVRVIFQSEKVERYSRNAFAFQDGLIEILGREVDMISGREIQNPYLNHEIEETQVLLYAA